MSNIIDLTFIHSSKGFDIVGDAAGDRAGYSVSGAGDVNGDGIDDVIIGARFGDDAAADAGEAYVIYGKLGITRGTVDLGNLNASDGFVIRGAAAGDQAGMAVSGAGDVDGDGIGDLLIGAPYCDADGINAGRVYVVYGAAGSTRATVNLASIGQSEGFIVKGDLAGDTAGFAVAAAGDVNGDGLDDIILGAPYGDDGGYGAGEAYVIYGKSGRTVADLDLSTLQAADGFIIQGDGASDIAGRSVSGAGDVNGDGIDDILVGAPFDATGGEVYVIYGKQGTSRTVVDRTGLSPSDGFAIQADATNDFAGWSVSNGGDVNGDSINDIIIGAVRSSDGGTSAGEAIVVYGKSGNTRGTLDLTGLSTQNGFSIQGDAIFDNAGRSVSSAGDVNGDGFDDLIVGVYRGSNLGRGSGGEAYLIYGVAGTARLRIDLTTLSEADGFVLVGRTTDDNAGVSVSAAGDVNGDGLADIIVGADRNDAGGAEAGAAYVIYGSRPTVSVLRVGSDIGQLIMGGDAADVLDGLGGNDTLDGGTGTDSLLGGLGFDFVRYSASSSAVQVDLGQDIAAGGHAADDVLIDIEGIIGTRFHDLLVGDAIANFLDGGAGNDTITGGGAGDTLVGGLGVDILDYASAAIGVFVNLGTNEARNGDAGGDSISDFEGIIGTAFADVLIGSDDDDLLTGGAGADSLAGGAGGDTLTGGAGFDLLDYAQANAAIVIDLSLNFASGSDAAEDVISGFEAVLGGSFADRLTGSSAANALDGGAGNDTIAGGAGNDTLTGGLGRDALTGGIGNDSFAFASMGDVTAIEATTDVILDFKRGQDKIDLSLIDASTVLGTNDAFVFRAKAAIGTSSVGEISFKLVDNVGTANDFTLVFIDTDADKAAEGMIKVMGLQSFVAGDFIL